NAVQPTLAPHHQIGPGTIKDVPVRLVPTPTGAVDNAGPRSSGSATLPLRGAEPGPGSVKAASAAAAGAELLSAPVAVGKARFVGVSWPALAVKPSSN